MKFSRTLSQGIACCALFLLSNSIHAYQAYNNQPYSAYNNCGSTCGPTNCCPNFGLQASYLYWNVQQDYLGFGAENLITGPNTPTVPNHIWDSGFRLEGRISDKCGPVGFHAEWTYFKTSNNVRVAANTSASPIPSVAALAAPVGLGNSWKIDINEFAFDIDYRFCLNPCFSLRPYVGIYGASINQKNNILLDLSAIVLAPGAPNLGQVSINRKNDFWGIGPRIGIGGSWNFVQQFSFVFDTNLALLLGKTKAHYNTQFARIGDIITPAVIPNYIFDSNKSIWSTRPMASAFLGLNWNAFCICRSILSLSVGYEVQYWWNQWRGTDSVIDQFLVGQNRNGDLALNGLVASIGIVF